MEISCQPYSGGPALIRHFGSTEMRELILTGTWQNEFSLKRSLGIDGTEFLKFTLLPGGPNEISEVCLKDNSRFILALSGFGFVLVTDQRVGSPYLSQPSIFRINSGKDEGVFIPKDFAAGFLFKAPNCLFMELGVEGQAPKASFSPFSFKINFSLACGVGEGSLKPYKGKDT